MIPCNIAVRDASFSSYLYLVVISLFMTRLIYSLTKLMMLIISYFFSELFVISECKCAQKKCNMTYLSVEFYLCVVFVCVCFIYLSVFMLMSSLVLFWRNSKCIEVCMSPYAVLTFVHCQNVCSDFLFKFYK